MPGLFTSRPVANDSSSETCFKMAQYWLKTCLETHDSLCQIQGSLPFPTRVLDVGLLASPFVNLSISNGRHGQWLTLSHCWGKTQPAATTKSNLNNHCTGIIISKLPQTFRDAILITRKLGYQFLWIDSLCIVQDSLIDWQEESVKMNTIYSNAVLNISADAAADSFQGIFSSSNRKIDGRTPITPPPRPDLIQIPVHSPKTGLKSTLYANRWHYDRFLDNDPLQERGWVLAEAVLSRRRLRYTSGGLAWSCPQVPTFCEETRPHQIHDLVEQSAYINSVYQIPYESLPPRYVHEGERDERYWEIIEWWYRRVSDYINRQLTFQHDKFPAFSGIAKTYSDRTGYSYKAGILVEDFRRGLLWQTCGRPVDIEVAPSWSWAVVGHQAITHPKIYEWVYAHQTYVADPNEVELIDICVANLRDDPFGQVISGSLTLRGLCHCLNELLKTAEFYFLSGWRSHVDCRDRNYRRFTSGYFPQGALELYMDVMDESNSTLWRREDIHILRIGMFSSEPTSDSIEHRQPPVEATSFLLLQEIPGLEASYRRIGIAKILGRGVEGPDWKMKTVTIL